MLKISESEKNVQPVEKPTPKSSLSKEIRTLYNTTIKDLNATKPVQSVEKIITTVPGHNVKSEESYISHEFFSPNLKADIKHLGKAVDQNKYLLASGLLLGGAELAGIVAAGGAIAAVATELPALGELGATAGAGALSSLSDPVILELGAGLLGLNTASEAMRIEAVKHEEKK